MGGRLDKKRRMVGTGDLGPCLVDNSSTHNVGGTSHQVDRKLEEMEEKFNEEREKRMKLEEDMKILYEKMDQFMSHQSHNSSYSVLQSRSHDSEEV